MHTWKMTKNPKDKKDAVLCQYFLTNTTDAKCMYNTANFYIRNTMTGIKKSPEERTANETEVLRCVFNGILKANVLVDEKYDAAMDEYNKAKKLYDEAVEERKKAAEQQDQETVVVEVSASTDGETDAASGPSDEASSDKEEELIEPEKPKDPKYFKYPTPKKWFLSYETLDAIFKLMKNPVYCRMNSQVNQNAIRKLAKTWAGYFAALADYKKNPSKYKAKPKMPRYLKSAQFTAWYTNQTAQFKIIGSKAYIRFVRCKELFCIGNADLYEDMKYVKTEVKPSHGRYDILVTFDDRKDDKAEFLAVPENPKRIIGIDPGVDNFATVVNNFGVEPFLIKGGAIKAKNQWYNKRRAIAMSKLTKGSDSTHSVKNGNYLDTLDRKREDFMRDFFYKAAWHICRFAMDNNADVIVFAHNKDQKQEINIGKANNQNFVSIAFCSFESILIHTAAKCKIPVIVREESYTSKASVLDNDPIPTYKQGDSQKYTFSGERINRGLYRSADGTLINADVNGGANIIRKEYPDAFKGQNLDYLWKTTKVVKYTDLYKGATSTCKEGYNNKQHRTSPNSKIRHFYRKNTRLEYRMFWGKSKSAQSNAETSA